MKENQRQPRAGDVMLWLDQGPAVLLEQCEIESEALTFGEFRIKGPAEKEAGWVINLLDTDEILTVHEETLAFGNTVRSQ